jgi:hypothetical protein
MQTKRNEMHSLQPKRCIQGLGLSLSEMEALGPENMTAENSELGFGLWGKIQSEWK